MNGKKKQASFEYLERYNTSLHQVNQKLQLKFNILKQDKTKITEEEMAIKLLDPETRAELYQIAYYFENLSIGILREYINEDIVKDSLFNVCISTYYSLKPYFEIRKMETKRDIGRNFRKLALRWEGNKILKP